MATYAAFKHVELHKVGNGKNRVPNAPRGCIGEIFGDGSQGNNNSAPTSSGPDTPSRPRDTHSRLFGGPQQRAAAGVSGRGSSISLGESASNGGSSNGGNGHHEPAPANGHHGHANGQSNGHVANPGKEGNPITGDGYKSLNGEINTYVAPLNGNAQPINHNRVPPGGYSSGLW